MVLRKLSDLLPLAKSKGRIKNLAVVKAEDEHSIEAVMKAAAEKVINPILIGEKSKILEMIKGYDCPVEIIDIKEPDLATKKAIELVHEGKADYIMKGYLDTAVLMRIIVAKENNMRTDKIMSHIAFIQNPNYHKLIALTDSSLNPKPNLEMKKQIILNAVAVMHSFGIEKPKVAVLAAAEKLNEKLQESVDAFKLKEMYLNGEITGCYVEGPISIDLAIEKESAIIKNYESPVAGDADLLVAPDLVSGNLMGKGMLFTGAVSGGIIIGAKTPIVLCSRASTVDDKYTSILLGAIACK